MNVAPFLVGKVLGEGEESSGWSVHRVRALSGALAFRIKRTYYSVFKVHYLLPILFQPLKSMRT